MNKYEITELGKIGTCTLWAESRSEASMKYQRMFNWKKQPEDLVVKLLEEGIKVHCPENSDLDKAVQAGGFCMQNTKGTKSVELHNRIGPKFEVSLFDHNGTCEGLAFYSKAQLLRWFPVQVFDINIEVLSDFGMEVGA